MATLLLIDDEADVQYSFRRIFDSPEIELTTAASGEEGLKIIPRLKPDLVIMDVRMGGISGLETLRRIRQMRHKAKRQRIGVGEHAIKGHKAQQSQNCKCNGGLHRIDFVMARQNRVHRPAAGCANEEHIAHPHVATVKRF